MWYKVPAPHLQKSVEGSSMALVLCTGVDAVLMKTRQLLLEHAGHQVVTAMDEPTVVAACRQQIFHVAVIGQSASTTGKRRIAALIRKHCPSAKLLELYWPSTGRILPDADSWLEVPTTVPQELAERVSALSMREH